MGEICGLDEVLVAGRPWIVGLRRGKRHQSPKLNPLLHIYFSPACRRMYSTQAFMLGYCSRKTRSSPKAWYTVQGNTTATSAHPADPAAPFRVSCESTFGTTNGTAPSSS